MIVLCRATFGVCLAAVFALAATTAQPLSHASQHASQGLHSPVPLGYIVIQLKPSKATVTFLAVAECPEVEGAQQLSEGLKSTIISADGLPLTHFPKAISFRLTASLRKSINDPPEHIVDTTEDPRQFLLQLGFRLKVYHGLDVREMEPATTSIIGVPAEIVYDERVFRVTFDLGDAPVTDRLILEAVSPQGETLAHFAFKLL